MASQVQGPAERAGTEASRHFGRKFAAGLAIGAAAIGAGLVKATASATRGIAASVKAASDLNETVNKTNVIFGKSSGQIQRWAKGASQNLGLSRQEALANASAFGDMFRQIGFGIQPAANMSRGMVKLAADLASFHNADITQVLEAQQAAFRGEYDSLQRFVPAINAARVQQVAMTMTGKKNAQQLTAQEKAAATYTIMLHDTKSAQGDFARTSGGLANSQRALNAQWQDLKATLGQAFLPAVQRVTHHLATKLGPNLLMHAQFYMPRLRRAVNDIADSFIDLLPDGQQMNQLFIKLEQGIPRVAAGFRRFIDQLKEMRPQFSGIGRGAREIGPALTQAGGAGHIFANSLAIIGPVLDVVARNIHNVIPWLPALLAGFLAFRAVRSVISPISQLGETIANFTSPATALATFLNARANKALAAALTERSIAETAAARAAGADAVATTAAGNAAAGAAGKTALFGGGVSSLVTKLGLFGAAAGALIFLSNRMSEELHKGADEAERSGRMMTLGGKGGQFFAERVSGLTAVTTAAAVAAERHEIALRGQTAAIQAAKSAQDEARGSSLDLRQAQINLSRAQGEVTRLAKEGRKGSLDYRQAQIDLKRAQIDLREKTAAYKEAQQKANAATSGAMRASQQARPSVYDLGEAARRGGNKAHDAKTPWRQLGDQIAGTYRQIHNKSARITANFGWTGLKVFRVGGGGPAGQGLKAFAAGGRITQGTTPTADDVLIRASRGETVVSARDSAQPEFQSWAASRGIPGFKLGGVIPSFGMTGQRGFVRALAAWPAAVERVLDRAAARFKKWSSQFGVGRPGVLNFIRSTDPLPYIWGGAGPRGYDCSGLVGAVALAHRGRPYGHGQRVWTTSSIHSGVLGIRPGLGGVLDIGVTAGTGHMGGRYGGPGGLKFEARSTRSGIIVGSGARDPRSFARHYTMARGGRITDEMADRFAALLASGVDLGGDPDRTRINGRVYDRGGYLYPGATVAVNRTGRPERVVPPGPQVVTLDRASLRELGTVIAYELARTPLVATMNPNEARQHIKTAQRRAGIPAREQIR